MRRLITPCLFVLLVLLPLVAIAADEISVMSFNIRYGTAEDGENSWKRRRILVLDAIRHHGPDLLGTQEALEFQVDFLGSSMSSYEFHGVGRDDGERAGEMCAIYYKKLFERLDGGHFWLSETPEIPGSRSWDSACTRMVSWVKLLDKRGDGRELFFFNTHFDHHSQEARNESAKLLKRKIAEIAGSAPVIVTGDFNAAPNRMGQDILTWELMRSHSFPLLDSFDEYIRAENPQGPEWEAAITYNGFQDPPKGNRIDWILHSSSLRTIEVEISRRKPRGRYPSDHFPVTARLAYESDEEVVR